MNICIYYASSFLIVHIIDMSATDGRDPVEDYKIIRKELGDFKEDLLKRAEILVANKMDVEGAEENLKEFIEKSKITDVVPISAITKSNLTELLYKIDQKLEEVKHIKINEVQVDEVVELMKKDKKASHREADDTK